VWTGRSAASAFDFYKNAQAAFAPDESTRVTARMSSAMKKRDIAKYAVAGTIAAVTVAAITGMNVAKKQRRERDEAEVRRIHETVSRMGVAGRLPEKMDPNTAPAAE
jgi:hypothetical protein